MTFLKLSLLDQQNRLSVVLKENYWTVKPQLIIFLAAIVLFLFSATDSVFTTATSAPSNRDTPVFNVSIKKKKIVF